MRKGTMIQNNDKDVKQAKEHDQMTHPTRDEFNAAFERLHDKLDTNKDHFNDKMNDLSREVTEIKTKVDGTKEVVVPTRPCPFFKEHEDEHKKLRHTWVRPIIIGVIVTIFLFIQEPIKIFIGRMLSNE